MPAVPTLARPADSGAAPQRFRARSAWNRLAALDFAQHRPALVLAAVFVVTRAPMLNRGYGADADAWRVAITARWLWAQGEYLPSRLPGYPLHELSAALLIGGGWLATNIATMLVSLAGVLLFARLVKRHGLPQPGLLTLTFAFTPLLWNNSTVTMDYMWGLTFVLAAYLALSDRRYLLAGLLLGLAAGFRPTSAAFAGPFLLVVLRERRLADAARMVGLFLLTAVLVFSPEWMRYGTRMFGFADFRPTWGQFARTFGVEAAGLMTAGSLALLWLLSAPRLRRVPRMVRRDGHFALWCAAVLVIAALVLRLPLEEGYLISAVPFFLLVMARLFRPALLAAACTVIVLGGFLDIHTASTAGWKSPTAILYLRPQPGRVIVDYRLRAQRMQVVREARAYPLPEKSALTMGYYYPIMVELYHDELRLRFREDLDPRIVGPLTDITEAVDDRGRAYVWLLNERQVRAYRRMGYTTWTMDYDSGNGLGVEETLEPALDRLGPR